MSNLDNANSAFSVAVYKKLQKQIDSLIEKISTLEESRNLIEVTPGPKGDKGVKGDKGSRGDMVLKVYKVYKVYKVFKV
jgi:hypothetical protein